MLRPPLKSKNVANVLTSSVTEKGQVTIPKFIRTLFNLHEHDLIGFRISNRKVEIVPVEIKTAAYSFSKEEWKKIEKLSHQRGKIFTSAQKAKEFARKNAI